jgi:hypothetical protein
VNPDVVRAIDDLTPKGILSPELAPRLRRIAAGELISVRRELGILLYFGVALIVAGVGLLVKENLGRIGPLTVAIAIGAAALGCLAWCWRKGKRTDLAFEYVLTLGALLVAADLAFIEVKFTPLGESWTWHLAIVAALYAALAFKFDSRSVFGLALTAFAAWRGVSLQQPYATWSAERSVFVEAVFFGTLFIVIGQLFERFRWKALFEPVAFWMGASILLVAMAGRPFTALLLATGVFLAWWAWHQRRVARFALGVGGAGYGLAILMSRGLRSLGVPEAIQLLTFTAVAGAVVFVVVRAQRALRAQP